MAAKYKSDFLNVLDQRGFIHQISDPEGLDAKASSPSGSEIWWMKPR